MSDSTLPPPSDGSRAAGMADEPGTVGEFGEFALIEAILADAAAVAGAAARADGDAEGSRAEPTRLIVGPGDDGAVIGLPRAEAVASMDLLVEGVHFRRDWVDARNVGRRAAAANLADILAMGGRPSSMLIGLGLPAETEVSWVRELARGIAEEGAGVGAQVVGGDVVAAPVVTVAITALGSPAASPILRSGAQPGDVVAVAGQLGWSAAGLAVLSRGFRSPRALVDAYRRPQPDYGAAAAAALVPASAMIDVSDGLVADLGHVARASGVTIDIVSDALPVAEALRDTAAAFTVDPLDWVLGGGEDHAFVATFRPQDVIPEGFVAIGSVYEADAGRPMVLVDSEPTHHAGWAHFQK